MNSSVIKNVTVRNKSKKKLSNFDESPVSRKRSFNTTPSKSDTSGFSPRGRKLKSPLNPSKSEFDIENLPSSSDSDDSATISCPGESSFLLSDISEDFGETAHDSVLDEFLVEDSNDKDAIIVTPSQGFLQSEESPRKSKLSNTFLTSKDTSKNYEANKSTPKLPISKAQFCHTDDGTLVILHRNDTLYFHGLLSLSVLHGQIEVFGQKLDKNSKNIKLYSLRGTALLYLKNVTQSNVELTGFLHTFNVKGKVKLTKNCAIVLCKKLSDKKMDFIEKHVAQQLFPKVSLSKLPRVDFDLQDNWNLIKINKHWDEQIEGISASSRMLLCGGKGVGKSTFLRYAINKLLMKFPEVRIIDLDPGQSEFTVPGCISIVTITEPLFGVNYTHLKTPDRSIISNINIAHDPVRYLESIKVLLKTSLSKVPTLINYMGYTHGIGLNILCAAISTIQPTDVLEIRSNEPKKNYRVSLDVEVVKDNAKIFVPSVPPLLNYHLHEVESMTDENFGWSAQPRQLRELCVLAHVADIIKSNSVFNTNAPTLKISLEDIVITDLNGETVHPAVVNANLVAICALADAGLKLFECLGFGIVRGIDMDTRELYLLTALDADLLERGTHLVQNGVSLPPSIYMTPDEVVGSIPYVMVGTLTDLGQMTKRSIQPVKK